MSDFSRVAAAVGASDILRVAAEVRSRRRRGQPVIDLSVGDLVAPELQPPPGLLHACTRALAEGPHGYPPPDGIEPARREIAAFLQRTLGLAADMGCIAVQGGARPLLYAIYRALVDPGEVVIDPVPSWNNRAYTALVGGRRQVVETEAEDGFLPRAEALQPHLPQARLLVLTSPSNPSGMTLAPHRLREIAQLVVDENRRRERRGGLRRLWLLWDQSYWQLASDDACPATPGQLVRAIGPALAIVDCASKAFAATGLRAGWMVAPPPLLAQVSALCGHIGAWAPRHVQAGLAAFLPRTEEVLRYTADLRRRLGERIELLCTGLQRACEGLPVRVLAAPVGLYVAIWVGVPGVSDRQLQRRLLEEAGLAAVDFRAFGFERDTAWLRLSVGSASREELAGVGARLRRWLERQAGAARAEAFPRPADNPSG